MRISLGLSGEGVTPSLVTALDGVGLIRGEYVFRHLHQYVTVPAAADWLTRYLQHVAGSFAPASVWYRTSDLEAREIDVLEGCDAHVIDRVPMFGSRGIRRAMALPEAFDAELAAIQRAACVQPGLGVLFPFIAEPSELDWAITRARRAGIEAPIGCMAEVPAAVLALDDLIACGITRVVVGCNDLGALTMGVARGSVRYRGVSSGLARMIDRCREVTSRHGVELALAGYLTADHLELARSSGVDECVVHYADLPHLLGAGFAGLPDLGMMVATKEWTRSAMAARAGERPDALVAPSPRPERRRWPRDVPMPSDPADAASQVGGAIELHDDEIGRHQTT